MELDPMQWDVLWHVRATEQKEHPAVHENTDRNRRRASEWDDWDDLDDEDNWDPWRRNVAAQVRAAEAQTKQRTADSDSDRQLRMDLAVQALEMKAASIRSDLGDAEIDRRTAARHERWQREQAALREYHREAKASRQRHEALPPHPLAAPQAWQDYLYTKRWKGLNP